MPERKIWELKNQTVCSILGLTYNDRELGDLFKRLKLDCDPVTAYDVAARTRHPNNWTGY